MPPVLANKQSLREPLQELEKVVEEVGEMWQA